jgi:hypothetical protein
MRLDKVHSPEKLDPGVSGMFFRTRFDAFSNKRQCSMAEVLCRFLLKQIWRIDAPRGGKTFVVAWLTRQRGHWLSCMS